MIVINFVLDHGLYLPVLGYVLGSIPFSLVVSRLFGAGDIREGGSGHATTTNTIRQLGWLPGALVLLLDIGKGYLSTYLAVQGEFPLAVVMASASLAVVGHIWPVFAGFRGGMGLSPAGGAYLAVNPLGGLIALGTLIGMVLLYGHAARGSALAALAIPAVLWLAGQRGPLLWTAIVVGWILAYRFYREDWDREYSELWLDRDKAGDKENAG